MDMAERQTAGCVVLKRQTGRLLVLTIQIRNRDDPRLPKGGIEKGETYEECAIRETFEETGYRVRLLPCLPVTVSVLKEYRKPALHLTVRFFLAAAVSGSPSCRLDQDLISRVVWLPAEVALKRIRLAEENLALHQCLERFRQYESARSSDRSTEQ